MSGIYIHIPFCKQKCTYCDFYTIVAPSKIEGFTNALVKEIGLRSNYLSEKKISTLYFGGGTPSLLTENQLELIIQSVYSYFEIETNAEITIEVNPDDLTFEYLQVLSGLPFNRLSIGIQSFNDEELKFVNRRHTAQQAIEAFQSARKSGFNNISIDLIYGLPGQDMNSWNYNIQQALQMNPEHISVYGLTFEEGTPLFRQKIKGKIQSADDDKMIKMHQLMMDSLVKNGYENYEISNYAKKGKRSRHNSSYWNFSPYAGFGPSAHSFDGVSRQWNVASVGSYVERISKEEVYFEKEVLTDINLMNEFILVKLRTKEGINIKEYDKRFGENDTKNLLLNISKQSFAPFFEINDQNICLNNKGILISDYIIMQLMKIE